MLLLGWAYYVEMAGAIIELTRNSMRDDFTKFNPKNSRVILVEGSPRVLSAYSKELSDIALKDLVAMGGYSFKCLGK